MGLTPVPDDYIAAVVTHLEMLDRPAPRPLASSPLRIIEWPTPRPDVYRALFRRVGEPWLWFSRLVIGEAALVAIIHHRHVKVFAIIDPQGLEIGLLELDFRQAGECEIAYFGLVPELNGRGHGRWLMGQALSRAWAPGITRVWVHTCSLDHPSALNFYRRQGFTAFRRELETFPDPRLSGHLPPDCAPQVPVLRRL